MSQNQRVDSQAKAQEILNRERSVNQVIMRLKATEESYQEEYQRLKARVEEQFHTSDIALLREKYKNAVTEEAKEFAKAEQELAEVEALCEHVQTKLNELTGS